MEDKIQYLLELTKSHEVNTIRNVYVKNLVNVGHLAGIPVYCNFISGSLYNDKLSIGVLFNKTEDDLYGESYDFGNIGINDNDYVSECINDIVLNDTFLTDIINELKSDSDFLDEQLVIKFRNMKDNLKIHKDSSPFEWDEKKQYHKDSMFLEKLSYRCRTSMHEDTLKRMESMSEAEFNAMEKRTSDILMDILKDETL